MARPSFVLSGSGVEKIVKYLVFWSIIITFAFKIKSMRYSSDHNREGDYTHYTVEEPLPLLEWLLKNVGQTRSKLKFY